ncbi:MAG: hypothetical protein MK102_02165 [Fuerstiella sp.]|nr:hypothetical protein [Fuerstiella sp.]
MSDSAPRSTQVTLWSVLPVAAVFAAYSLLHVAVPGVNEPHYLCKAKATWDLGYCSDDFFLKSESAHSVFFFIVGYFTQNCSLENVAVAGRIISAMVLAWGWTALCAVFSLTRSGTVIAATLLAAISLTGNLSGEWILGGFESKVPAWGLGFTGMACWLNTGNRTAGRRSVATGLLLGLSTAAHPVVGAWLLIAISMSELAQLYFPLRQWANPGRPVRSTGFVVSSLFIMNGTALVAALPGLIPAIRMLAASDLSHWERATAHRIQVFVRLGHHLDPSQFPPAAWIHSAVLLTVIGCCSWHLHKTGMNPVLRRHLLLLTSAIVIAVAGLAVGFHKGQVLHLASWSWRAFLLKFYPFRLIDTLLPLTTSLTFTAIMADNMRVRTFGTGPLLRHIVPAVFVLGVLVASWRLRDDSPNSYRPHEYSTWIEACDWIRTETPKESLFVTPRESVAFKWHAQRAEFVCFKDCPQDNAGILKWWQRLRDLGRIQPVQLKQPLKASDLQRMQKHMQITHMITRDHVVTDQEPIYENTVWRIYDVELPSSRPPSNSTNDMFEPTDDVAK